MLRLADEFGAIGIDTHAAFDRVLEHTPSSAWADDREHLRAIGRSL